MSPGGKIGLSVDGNRGLLEILSGYLSVLYSTCVESVLTHTVSGFHPLLGIYHLPLFPLLIS